MNTPESSNSETIQKPGIVTLAVERTGASPAGWVASQGLPDRADRLRKDDAVNIHLMNLRVVPARFAVEGPGSIAMMHAVTRLLAL